MSDNKFDLNRRILDNEDLGISEEQKQEAIKKEDHYRKLYYTIFDLNSTRDFKQLAKELIDGYNKMVEIYKDPSKNKKDIDFIIKFAFRDFFLLIFMNMKTKFDNDDFLKKLHREVYLSENYVTIDQFEALIDYCKKEYEQESDNK